MYLLQLMLGLFMVLYRFRWVWDPAISRSVVREIWPVGVCACPLKVYGWDRWFNAERHRRLEAKLMECGYWPWLAVPVAIVELAAGAGLILNIWPKLCALGLLVILVAATIKTAKQKIASQYPVDTVDRVSCYLWTVEPLYIVMCLVILFN